MAIIAFVESSNHRLKKSAFEVTSFSKYIAAKKSVSCIAVVVGNVENADQLATYGAEKIISISNDALSTFDSQVYSQAILEVMESYNGTTLVFSHSALGKSLAGRMAIKLGAGLVTSVNSLPEENDVYDRPVFSGKANCKTKINTDIQVLTLMGNSVPLAESKVQSETISFTAQSLPVPKISVIETKTQDGVVPLPEAELVVSAGRGMKGPENWGIIEELAKILNATIACSRPVADIGWRPHHEHVGQTGLAIRPNLYIAIGISGAIQHLAGVNGSKTIVVINKDPEAPFFKAANYGVCGDLFEVVPRLIQSLKQYNSSNN